MTGDIDRYQGEGSCGVFIVTMPVVNEQDELSHVLSLAKESLVSSVTESDVLEILMALSRIIEDKNSSLPSVDASCGAIRDHIRNVLARGPCGTVIVAAAMILVKLMARVSSAYEELCLSTCLFHMASISKPTVTFNCNTKCNRTRFLCSPSGHVPVEDYKKFWVDLVALSQVRSFNIRSPGFCPLFLDAMVHLLCYGNGIWVHAVVTSGIETILSRTDVGMTASIYKLLLPVMRMSLPSENRSVLIDVIKHTASCETVAASSHVGSSATGHAYNPIHIAKSNSSSSSVENEIDDLVPAPIKKQCLPFLRFLELSCIHVGDTSEQRSTLSALIRDVLHSLDSIFFEAFEAFILRVSQHPVGRVRLFAVELVPALTRAEDDRFGEARSRGIRLIQLLADRVHDRVPTVRVKAIHSLKDVFTKLCEVKFPYGRDELICIAFDCDERIRDLKSRVRKAAVEYIGLVSYHVANLHHENCEADELSEKICSDTDSLALNERKSFQLVTLLKERSFDSVSNVRLSTIGQVTKSLLNSASGSALFCRKLMSLWCEAVLPHIDDADARCRETCIKAVESVLFSWRSTCSSQKEDPGWSPPSPADNTVFTQFLFEIGGNDYNVSELGRKSIALVTRKGSLESSDIHFLYQKINSVEDTHEQVRRGAWLALAEAARSGKAKLVYKTVDLTSLTEEIVLHGNSFACRIVSKLVQFMDESSCKDLSSTLKRAVFVESGFWQQFSARDCISSVLQLLSSLHQESGSDLLDHCERKLLGFESSLDDAESETILFLVGSICASFPLKREPPKQLLVFVLAHTSKSCLNSRLRALALTTLGKICLSHCNDGRCDSGPGTTASELIFRDRSHVSNLGESLARRHVSIFVHELDNATSSATRNNAVIVLCDICRQFTAVVEPYVSRLAGLLSDRSDFIRIQVISSLVNLLQEDYIKMRTGPILFQLAGCLVDKSKTVRTTAEYSLLQVVSSKNPSILATSFVELLHVLNDCDQSQIYNKSGVSSQFMAAHRSICDDFNERLRIYDVFLRGMTAEQRLRLPGRLRSEVLSLVCDGKLPLSNASVQRLLHDTLLLLVCDQVRQVATGKVAGENEPQENLASLNSGSDASRCGRGASKKMSLLGRVQILELRESTIPTLLEIRHHLEKARSPLLKVLMNSLCVLLQPHVSELETIVRDSVVRSEIQHEMTTLAKGNRKPRKLGDMKGFRVEKGMNGTGCKNAVKQVEESPNGGEETLPKTYSVPRTRPSRNQRRQLRYSQDSDDSGCEIDQRVEADPNIHMSARIDASPKLAAIASKARDECAPVVLNMDVDEDASGFALALSRIEKCVN